MKRFIAWLDRKLSWLKGRRTQIAAFLIAALGIIEAFGREVIPEAYQGFTLMTVALLMLVLRQMTTTAPGARK